MQYWVLIGNPMELEQLLNRYQQQKCTHNDILDAVVPVIHGSDVDANARHEID